MSRRRLLLLSLAAPLAATRAVSLAAGQLLVAADKSTDPDLGKAVALLVHSDERGAIGVIVNRRTQVPLASVFPAVKETAAGSQPVWFGGPVALGARALVRSTKAVAGAGKLFADVWLISDSALIAKMAAGLGANPDVFRVYAGYTGWSAAQLRNEVKAGLWKIIPGDPRVVFASHPEVLWPLLSRQTV